MHNNNEIRKRHPKFVVTTVITAAVMLIAITTISSISTESVLAYDKNQAKSDVNECGNGSLPENVGCQNTDSQIQGDENVVALTAQQTFPEPPPETATLIVIKNVKCVEGEECTDLPSPSAFLMQFQEANNPDPTSAPGSSEGTPFTLGPGDYIVNEALPPDPPGIENIPSIRSPDCSSMANGPIQAGEERTCIWTNVYRPVSPP